MGACRNQYLRDRFDRARQFLGHRAEDAALLALLDHGLAVDRGLRTPAEADVRRDIAAALCAAFDVYLLSDPVRHSLCGRIDPTDGRRRRVTDRSRTGVVRWNNIRARLSPRNRTGGV